MLLRLVPPAPWPTILFTLTFPTLPESLPLPPAWEAHLQLLADTRLSSPPSLHALDKSVAWTALLDIVTFDLTSLTVTCSFIDATREAWPLTNRCVDLLDSVIADVNRSAVEAEHEREPLSEPAPPLKPKKRRSIIASLMASLVPSSPSRPPSPDPPPASEEDLPCNGIPASRFLRRRARSTLVDAFRRFVLSELTPSTPPPMYALWVARSTMRRAAEEMARVIVVAAHTVVEERGDSDDDGSSVHTPLDSHDPPLPLAPPPGPTVLTPDAYHAYISLKALHRRLADLACRLEEGEGQAEDGDGECGVLEVRSRRRAWSMRRYGPEPCMALLGLGAPVRSSPLCRGWTAEDEDVQDRTVGERGRLRRTRSLWDERRRAVAVGKVKSREAEDVDERARDVVGRLAVGETQVGCYEVHDDDEEEEFERPTPLPWRTYHKAAPPLAISPNVDDPHVYRRKLDETNL